MSFWTGNKTLTCTLLVSIRPPHQERRAVIFLCNTWCGDIEQWRHDSNLFKLCWINLVCLLFGILIGSKIHCGKRRRCKSAFLQQHENEKTKISSRHRVIFSVYLLVRAKESQSVDLLFYLSLFMKWRQNCSSYKNHCQFSVQNLFSSVIISMSFHGRFWRLVHTCDANANANGNENEIIRPT